MPSSETSRRIPNAIRGSVTVAISSHLKMPSLSDNFSKCNSKESGRFYLRSTRHWTILNSRKLTYITEPPSWNFLSPVPDASLDGTLLKWVILLVTNDFYGGSSRGSKLGACGSGLRVEKTTVSFKTNGIARVGCGLSLYTQVASWNLDGQFWRYNSRTHVMGAIVQLVLLDSRKLNLGLPVLSLIWQSEIAFCSRENIIFSWTCVREDISSDTCLWMSFSTHLSNQSVHCNGPRI